MFTYNEMFKEVNETRSTNNLVAEEANINVYDATMVTMEGFLERINNIDNVSDQELFKLVFDTYDMVLNSTIVKKNKELAILLFNNYRYINTLCQVLERYNMTDIQRIYANNIIYDYKRANIEKDQSIVYAIDQLASVVNAGILPSLLGVGLPRDLALRIAVARFSSSTIQLTVRRVNKILFYLSNTDLVTETLLIRIYEQLYHSDMTHLFRGLMFDVYSKEKLDKSTSASDEIYSTMNLAVLTMLNTMPSDSIRTILKAYYDEYTLSYSGSPVRFSMKLSNDYYRINEVIYQLESEGIYLP